MITLFLATVIGWYLVITSLALLFRHEYIKAVIADILEHRGLFFLLTIFTLVIGLLLVVSHNIWIIGWPLIVTLFSWLVLIGALIRLFCPEVSLKMAKSALDHPLRVKIATVVFLIVGLFLLFQVYYVYW